VIWIISKSECLHSCSAYPVNHLFNCFYSWMSNLLFELFHLNRESPISSSYLSPPGYGCRRNMIIGFKLCFQFNSPSHQCKTWVLRIVPVWQLVLLLRNRVWCPTMPSCGDSHKVQMLFNNQMPHDSASR
jgi:hypothetical protein